jgi:RNA recognition motif-containing protein
MAEVKVLYVRNLTSEVSENDVKDFFLPYGNIERVRKVRVCSFSSEKLLIIEFYRTMPLFILINGMMH